VAFALLPAAVAYAVPVSWALLSRWHHRYRAGIALVLAGTILLIASVREFYVAGRGT